MSKRMEIRGDELDLYAEFHFELVRKVQARVNTSRENVEDACGFAWLQFLKHQPDRDGAWKGWLFRVAQREAYTLDARERRHGVLVDGFGRDVELPDPHDRHAERDEFIAAVQELGRLPPRLRQLVLLRSQVDTQKDLAEQVGLSAGRVSVLLRNALSVVEGSETHHSQELARPPKVERLRELETDPPTWLVNAIGRPGTNSSPGALVLAWRRAALQIADYRERSGQRSSTDAIGPAPSDLGLRRAHRRVDQAIQDLADIRAGRSSGHSR